MVPIDFSGHRSSGIAAIAYAELRRHLGLPARPIRVYDPIQQLAIVDEDVLTRFGVDTIEMGRGFARETADWQEWVLPDGTPCLMPVWATPGARPRASGSCGPRAGAVLGACPTGPCTSSRSTSRSWKRTTSATLPRAYRGMHVACRRRRHPPAGVAGAPTVRERLREGAAALRASTDRAIIGLFGGNLLEIGQFLYRNDNFLMLLAGEPERAARVPRRCRRDPPGEPGAVPRRGRRPHRHHPLRRRPGHADRAADVARDVPRFFKPRHSLLWNARKAARPAGRGSHASARKVMLHCCGGIRSLLPDLIEAGLDAVNPVQISTAGMEASGSEARLRQGYGLLGRRVRHADRPPLGNAAGGARARAPAARSALPRRRIRVPAGAQHPGRRAASEHRRDVRRRARVGVRLPEGTMLTVHMIGNAHLDPVWLWRWPAGVGEALATCRSACDLLDDEPDVVFTRSDAWLYERIEALDPGLFARIEAHVAAGRWAVVGGWYLQPDCNLPLAASFRKQMEIGRRHAREKLGVEVTVGYNVDSFGHTAALPRLLREGGYDSYVMMRPMAHERTLPAALFRWTTPGDEGPGILTWRLPLAYCTSADELGMQVEAALACAVPGIEHVMCFYGVGDHGGGPTRRQTAWIRAHRDAFPGARLVFSHPRAFFDAVKPHAARVPEVSGELQMHAIGCYGVVRDIKTGMRRAEHALLAAEAATTAFPRHAPPDAASPAGWRVAPRALQPVPRRLRRHQPGRGLRRRARPARRRTVRRRCGAVRHAVPRVRRVARRPPPAGDRVQPLGHHVRWVYPLGAVDQRAGVRGMDRRRVGATRAAPGAAGKRGGPRCLLAVVARAHRAPIARDLLAAARAAAGDCRRPRPAPS